MNREQVVSALHQHRDEMPRRFRDEAPIHFRLGGPR